MGECIDKNKVLGIIADMQVEHHYDAVLLEVADKIKELPLIDIEKLIQARLRGIQKIKLDAIKSSDRNTAYMMLGAENLCNEILADLGAIIGSTI